MKLHTILFLSLVSISCIAMDVPEGTNPRPANDLAIFDELNNIEAFKQAYESQLLTLKTKLILIPTPISTTDLQRVNTIDETLPTLYNQMSEKGICLCDLINEIDILIGRLKGEVVDSVSESTTDTSDPAQ